MKPSYRALWISDIHLGTNACRAGDLLDFLEEVRADRLYLVGDIIDLEKMKSTAGFRDNHMRVLRRFVDLARRDCEVTYVPGNHDKEFRSVLGATFFGIPVVANIEHTTSRGERYLVLHGDEFDRSMHRQSSLERIGSLAYDTIVEVDALVNRLRRKWRRDYLPISAHIKCQISLVNEFINRFENVASTFAAEQGFDGIICGHIHKPAIRRINNVVYANDGDWVEHGSALAEKADGTLELLRWSSDAVHSLESHESLVLAS